MANADKQFFFKLAQHKEPKPTFAVRFHSRRRVDSVPKQAVSGHF